jgi:NAD(P)-dependent dehydrogenase (short-subunit alcohol dehydrogenase family)
MSSTESKNTKAILVTGCSSGIGREIAVHMAGCGYVVFASVRKAEDAEKLKKQNVKNLVPLFPLDLRKPEQIAEAGRVLEKELEERKIEGLYAVVNNAGGGFIAPLELMDLEKMRAEAETRILGPIALLQATLPLVRRGNGRILWIQTPSLMPIAFDASIHAWDFASNCLSRTLQQELLPWGIPSIQIRCGGIKTPSVEKCYTELEQSMAEWSASGRSLYHDALKKAEMAFRDFDKKRSEPELIARVVEKALSAKKPKRRYQAGHMSGIAAVMECLPQPWTDAIMSKR